MTKLKMNDLTHGERLFVWRRREGLSQKQAAKHWKVTLPVYREWEAVIPTGGDTEVPNPPVVSLKKLGSLKPHEAFTMLRRRFEVSQATLAETLGVTQNYLCLMERGKTPSLARLEQYWANI